MSDDAQTHELQLNIDTTGETMDVSCENGWVIHFQHRRILAPAHIIEFSTGVVDSRLGDAVDQVVRMAEELMAGNYMAVPDGDSAVDLSWDPLGDVYAPDGGMVTFE